MASTDTIIYSENPTLIQIKFNPNPSLPGQGSIWADKISLPKGYTYENSCVLSSWIDYTDNIEWEGNYYSGIKVEIFITKDNKITVRTQDDSFMLYANYSVSILLMRYK